MKTKKTTKLICIAISIIMILALATGCGSSKSKGGKLDAIKKAGKIVICTDAAWAPFEYSQVRSHKRCVRLDLHLPGQRRG